MNDLQQKMLDMVCEIDAICQKHKIEYCLYAGSGLGAERHKGFIPWDDDADIMMTLENYEKFLEVFDREAMENRVLNCLEKSTDYPFTYARYVDTQTSAIQRHTAFDGVGNTDTQNAADDGKIRAIIQQTLDMNFPFGIQQQNDQYHGTYDTA